MLMWEPAKELGLNELQLVGLLDQIDQERALAWEEREAARPAAEEAMQVVQRYLDQGYRRGHPAFEHDLEIAMPILQRYSHADVRWMQVCKRWGDTRLELARVTRQQRPDDTSAPA